MEGRLEGLKKKKTVKSGVHEALYIHLSFHVAAWNSKIFISVFMSVLETLIY